MHITARVDYALQSMLALADADPDPVAALKLAERLDLSYHYLLSVIGELRRAGYVKIRRGRNGGLLLARSATEITLGEIIEVIDGPLTFSDGRKARPIGLDPKDGSLPALWVAGHRAMLDVFSQIRLADARRAPVAAPQRQWPTHTVAGGLLKIPFKADVWSRPAGHSGGTEFSRIHVPEGKHTTHAHPPNSRTRRQRQPLKDRTSPEVNGAASRLRSGLQLFLVAAVALVCALGVLPASEAQAAPPFTGVGGRHYFGSSTLETDQRLNAGSYLLSPNGKYALILQEDGNLVLYSGTVGGSGVLWSAGTRGNDYLIMQGDGNLVLYAGGHALWASNTAGYGQSRFAVQDDGNLVVYTVGGRPLWSSHTVQGNDKAYGTYHGSDTLQANGDLVSREFLRSSDNRFFTMMQTDGNLVLYGPGYHPLWASASNGCAADNSRASMRDNGNFLVTNASGRPCFSRFGRPGAHIVMQSDGNLVLYNTDGSAAWASNTAGKI